LVSSTQKEQNEFTNNYTKLNEIEQETIKERIKHEFSIYLGYIFDDLALRNDQIRANNDARE
jgi:hypothetical protein